MPAESTFRIEVTEDSVPGSPGPGASGTDWLRAIHDTLKQSYDIQLQGGNKTLDVLAKIWETEKQILQRMPGGKWGGASPYDIKAPEIARDISLPKDKSPFAVAKSAYVGGGGIGGAIEAGIGASAGGPVVAAMQAVADTIKGGIRYISEAIATSAEPAQSLTEVVGRTTQGVEKLGLAYGIAIEAVKGFTSIVDAFIARGRTLSQYNPDLAVSFARSDVRSMMQDIKEGQELGPGIAKLNDVTAEVLAELREILLPMKKALIEQLVPMMEWALQETKAAGMAWNTRDAALELFKQEIFQHFRTEGRNNADYRRARDAYMASVQGYIQRRTEALPNNDLLSAQLRELMRGAMEANPPRPPDAIPDAAFPQMFIPPGAF